MACTTTYGLYQADCQANRQNWSFREVQQNCKSLCHCAHQALSRLQAAARAQAEAEAAVAVGETYEVRSLRSFWAHCQAHVATSCIRHQALPTAEHEQSASSVP